MSYAFALVSIAVGLTLESDAIQEARIALGGVAHKPWRVPEAEKMLEGEAPNRDRYKDAAEAIIAGAAGFTHNSFKIDLARRAIVRALEQAASGRPQIQSLKAIR
jgi:xanthine dehydrogenase YagS FAD-binding subunit